MPPPLAAPPESGDPTTPSGPIAPLVPPQRPSRRKLTDHRLPLTVLRIGRSLLCLPRSFNFPLHLQLSVLPRRLKKPPQRRLTRIITRRFNLGNIGFCSRDAGESPLLLTPSQIRINPMPDSRLCPIANLQLSQDLAPLGKPHRLPFILPFGSRNPCAAFASPKSTHKKPHSKVSYV